MALRGTKKETVEAIRCRIDLPRVIELLKEMSDMGDCERRLLQAGLNRDWTKTTQVFAAVLA